MTTKSRRSVAGKCVTCGIRTVRGDLEDGQLVEVEANNLTAADELRAWAAGVPTYRAVWKNHIEIRPRTDRDIKLNPAGYDGARIWKEHQCPTNR